MANRYSTTWHDRNMTFLPVCFWIVEMGFSMLGLNPLCPFPWQNTAFRNACPPPSRILNPTHLALHMFCFICHCSFFRATPFMPAVTKPCICKRFSVPGLQQQICKRKVPRGMLQFHQHLQLVPLMAHSFSLRCFLRLTVNFLPLQSGLYVSHLDRKKGSDRRSALFATKCSATTLSWSGTWSSTTRTGKRTAASFATRPSSGSTDWSAIVAQPTQLS